MRLGLVVNPWAKGASDPQLPARLQAQAERAGAVCQVAVTQKPADLPQAAAALAAFGMDVLAVCGGDGTLMTTLSAMAAQKEAANAALPPLLLLPAGTMNTVAKNLGLPPQPEALLRAALTAAVARGIAAVPHWPQDTLRVRTYGETPHDPASLQSNRDEGQDRTADEAAKNSPAPSQKAEDSATGAAHGAAAAANRVLVLDESEIGALPQRERCGFLFSGAMGARFLSAYTAAPEPGLRWALILALRTIASCLYPGGGSLARWLFTPTPMRLTLDAAASQTGKTPESVAPPAVPIHIEGAFRLLIMSTVADAGLGMRVPWRAGAVPGRFQLIASAISTLENALQLPRILRAEPLRGAPHYDLMTRAAQLRFDAPQTLVLDGELFRAAAVDVALGPRLRVLRPTLLQP